MDKIYDKPLESLTGKGLPFKTKTPKTIEAALTTLMNYNFDFRVDNKKNITTIFPHIHQLIQLALNANSPTQDIINKCIEFTHKMPHGSDGNELFNWVAKNFTTRTERLLIEKFSSDFFDHLTQCEGKLCISAQLSFEDLVLMINSKKDTLSREHTKVGICWVYKAHPPSNSKYEQTVTTLNKLYYLPNFSEVYFDYLSQQTKCHGSWEVFTTLCKNNPQQMTVAAITKALPLLQRFHPKQGKQENLRVEAGLNLLNPLWKTVFSSINSEEVECLIQSIEKLPETLRKDTLLSLLPIKNFNIFYINHIAHCNKKCGIWTLFESCTYPSLGILPPQTILNAQKALRRIKNIPFCLEPKKFCAVEGNKILAWHIAQQKDPSDRELLSLDAIDAMSRLITGRAPHPKFEPTKLLTDIALGTRLKDTGLEGKQTDLLLHFERRIKYMIHLFAFLWEDGGFFRLSSTPFTYGPAKIPENHHRCHSAIVASIDRKLRETNAPWRSILQGLFLEHKIIQRLNHTVVLPKACNTVDGMIEGKNENLQGGLRPVILDLLNQVAYNLSPSQAIVDFVKLLTARLEKLKSDFNKKEDKITELTYTRAHLSFLKKLDLNEFLKKCLIEYNIEPQSNVDQNWQALRNALREEKMEKN
ncbi:MAG: hypothetical protein JSR80_06400 [Verrucomicrobia bacterium]|nr:hypothetical protein [Verrucomicrobiota bacterium]